jgi:Fe-S cluster assembly protein SufD
MSAAFESLRALRDEALSGSCDGEADWIPRLRNDAFAAFEEQGFPTRRLEAWKGTNLARLEAMAFERVGAALPNRNVVAGNAAPELHFIDGRLDAANSQAASLPPGIRLLSFAEARRQAPELLEGRLAQLTNIKGQALVALQTAFLDDGAVLAIDPGVEVDSAIRIRFAVTADSANSPSAAFPRLLVIAGERSRAAIYLEHYSAEPHSTSETFSNFAPSGTESTQILEPKHTPGLTAFVAELHLAAGAWLEMVQIQNEDVDRVHFTSTHARLEADARLDSHVFTLSPGLVRSELEISLAEAGAETRMRGFFLGRGKGHVDHFTTVEHAADSCTSEEDYRGVLGDQSSAVFRGRVIVRPGAQKTDARQSNSNLLVSNRASIDSKPQLEIYADDVRVSHGSTIGRLDEEAIFFLRARGIDATDARLMLTRAFAHSIVDGIAQDALRETVASQVDRALASLDNYVPSSSGGEPQ